MTPRNMMIQSMLTIFFVLFVSLATAAQSITNAEAVPPASSGQPWAINVAFAPSPTGNIKRIILVNSEDLDVTELKNGSLGAGGIYTSDADKPLKTVVSTKSGKLELANRYEVRAVVENNKSGEKDLILISKVTLNDPNLTLNQIVAAKAKSVEDADVYISGELNGAHKRKTSFSTKISLERYRAITPRWRHTPFFKLNASTDPDADPDKMEIGWAFRYVTTPGYFDNKIKLESERDFGNTNLIYDTRFTFLPRLSKGNGNFKAFLNPSIGGEFGKNIRSPLKAAEGDGIARILAGADLRLAFYLSKESDEPEINWTTSYVRRWLLTDELRFEADKDGKLKLVSFGTSPRDYVSSKVSYKLTKFLGVFAEYEWGQVPPSYKFVDHRFRLGFEYKYKFGVK